MTVASALPIPEFFDTSHNVWGFSPDMNKLIFDAEEWRTEYDIPGGHLDFEADRVSMVVLGIDNNNDFIYPEGGLFVGGRSQVEPMRDTERAVRWMYTNMCRITEVWSSSDVHGPHHWFFATLWETKDGTVLSPNTIIVLEGEVFMNYDFTGKLLHRNVRPRKAVCYMTHGGDYGLMVTEAKHYVRELQRTGRHKLVLWSMHCLDGSVGGALSGIYEQARLFHGMVRHRQPELRFKGRKLSEYYSLFGAEVLTDHTGKQVLYQDIALMKRFLLEYDVLVLFGQASSHCVRYTLESLIQYAISINRPDLIRKIYVMVDCMSPVVVPGIIDYTEETDRVYANWADTYGLNLVESTTPMEEWPGIVGQYYAN